MTLKCKQCGKCCNDVILPWSPIYLKDSYIDWYSQKPNIKYMEDIYLVFPMLTFLYKDGEVYHYKCKHVIEKDRKWFCTIQDIKPRMCSKFPYGRKSYIEDCGFNEEGK